MIPMFGKGSSSNIDISSKAFCNRPSWQQMRIEYTADANDANATLYLSVHPYQNYVGQRFYFACAGLWQNGIPVSWHPSPSARPADSLSLAGHVGTEWTLLLTFQPEQHHWTLARIDPNAKLYVATIAPTDPNSTMKMQVYYTPGAATPKWTLESTDGATTEIIERPFTGGGEFHHNYPVRLAIRYGYDGDAEVTGPKFSLGLRTVSHSVVTDLPMADLSDADVTITYGDGAGGNQFPGTLSGVRLFPEALDAWKIAAEWENR
jgi:hypothetical protein